ncbi:hypothetical protein CSPX01_07498 [Colletotrichum filicis]|nr:hypothetical protein CSPX01_07498 [Colletotrichum filicis]
MAKQQSPVHFRTHKPGDMGLITQRHGIVYSGLGFDHTFEAFVARIAADFIDNHDSTRERCWIAEDNTGEFLGTIMLVQDKELENVAKLRLLLVDEKAQGLGVGTKLIQQCIQFARDAGYGCINLWTKSMLESARRLYAKMGFTVVKTEEHESWGLKLSAEMWQLKLASGHSSSPP